MLTLPYKDIVKKKAYERVKNRRYYAAHKNRENERCRSYHTSNSERRAAAKCEYRKNNPGSWRKWAKANCDRVRAAQKRYHARNPDRVKQWTARNAKWCALRSSLWSKANAHLKRAAKAKRRSAEINATPKWADFQVMKSIYREACRLTKETGIPHEVDHIIPLNNQRVCGLHWHANLRVVTRYENRRKNNRL